jgi:hypothetical protein
VIKVLLVNFAELNSAWSGGLVESSSPERNKDRTDVATG